MKTEAAKADYPEFLAKLKERILEARTMAVRAVNHELILLYWDIGQGIVQKQEMEGWGESVVERLSVDLRSAFPDMHGFSVANLWRMKQLYLIYTSPDFLTQAMKRLPPQTGNAEKLAQAVRDLVSATPWGHHVLMLGKVTEPAARLYYLRATAQFGWSRNVLLNQIKIGAFEPEHAGKMDFYLNVLNDKERSPDDSPSIGIILCAEKDDIEIEFALKTKQNPIGVAEYQLQAKLPAEFKGRLPSTKQLTEAVRNALEPEKKA
ncbi:MAG: PDDEXK nuclease domain-containing protein [Spirochaetota bacterium]